MWRHRPVDRSACDGAVPTDTVPRPTDTVPLAMGTGPLVT
jgi:hypothetical protein